MRQWLATLRLPWDRLEGRWRITLATADLGQRLVDASAVALREWWALTARNRTLNIYGAVLARPRRLGESVDDWRARLALWRQEMVATRGWLEAEVLRITGGQRIIDWPRNSMRYDAGRWDVGRWDDGPALLIGAPEAQIETLYSHLHAELPPDIGLVVLPVGEFDRV